MSGRITLAVFNSAAVCAHRRSSCLAPLRANMDAARGVLAQTARSSPLPLQARAEIASFLELFSGVPASTPVLQQLCQNPVYEPELIVHGLSADTRVALQWLTEEVGRGRRRCAVSVVWQQWIKPDAAPWTVDLSTLITGTQAHVRQVSLAAHRADATPPGMLEAIEWPSGPGKQQRSGPAQVARLRR